MAFAGAVDLSRIIDLIGVPLEYGAGTHGAKLGPGALRDAGLKARLEALGYRVRDLGDVPVPPLAVEETGGPDRPRHVAPIRAACEATAAAVERSLRAAAFPIVLGGDHSLAIGVLAGAARAKGPGGLIWIDAHADVNTTATSPTGNIHGMPVAVALGDVPALFGGPDFPTPSFDPRRCVFIALRDLDPGEKRAIRARGLSSFTMSDIDRMGMARVMERAVEIAGASDGASSTHVSLDIDALDPGTAPGTGTPVPGGLTYREAHLAMEMIAESGIAHSLEVVEVNPTMDDGVSTARVAVDLICSAMGKSIL